MRASWWMAWGREGTCECAQMMHASACLHFRVPRCRVHSVHCTPLLRAPPCPRRKFCSGRHPLLLRLLLGDKVGPLSSSLCSGTAGREGKGGPSQPATSPTPCARQVNVMAVRADKCIAMKEEYHQFRDRSALLMLLVPLLLVLGLRRADHLKGQAAAQGPGQEAYTFMPSLMTGEGARGRARPARLTGAEQSLCGRAAALAWAAPGAAVQRGGARPCLRHAGVQLYFMWLGYFYLATALRETVLLVNGSHIKQWWIQHHCWSAACALLMLGLPVYSQGARARGDFASRLRER